VNDLRNYINLFESMDYGTEEDDIVDEAIVDEAIVDEAIIDEDIVEEDIVDEAILDEFVEPAPVVDSGLDGMIDPRGLAKLLPEVDDINRFSSAVRKVQKGDNASLSIQETRQLAKAFISLLKDDSQMTMKVLQKLKMVSSSSAPTM
jgi:hypothetical protein